MIASKLCNNENPRESRSLGFSIPLWYGGLFHRLITDYLFLSNHLQMRWLITPAITETIRDSNISIINTPFPYRYRGGNIGIITHESVSFYMFWHSLLRHRNGHIPDRDGRYSDHLLLIFQICFIAAINFIFQNCNVLHQPFRYRCTHATGVFCN